jgi:Na+-transporting methylmalonyl-CoA/oxaloacetate decarboxylase gamma subunit
MRRAQPDGHRFDLRRQAGFARRTVRRGRYVRLHFGLVDGVGFFPIVCRCNCADGNRLSIEPDPSTALTTVISASYQSRALSRGLEAIPALLEGIHAAFWLGAGFSFSAMFIGVVMLRGMGTIGKVKKDEKEEEKEDDSAEQGQGEGAREVRGDEKV